MTKAIYDTRFLIAGYLFGQTILWPWRFADVVVFLALTISTIAGALAANLRHQRTIK